MQRCSVWWRHCLYLQTVPCWASHTMRTPIRLKRCNNAPAMQALSLLAHLLMDTFLGHEALMFKYIKSANNLMSIMNLLRAKSRSIQFEAFHVFKVRLLDCHEQRTARVAVPLCVMHVI